MFKKEGRNWIYNEDEVIDYMKNNSKKYNSFSNMCIKLGANKRSYPIRMMVVKYKELINSLEWDYSKNNIRFKAIYQDYDWCYYNLVELGLNHEEMAEKADTTKRTIKKWCVEKHKITGRLRAKEKKFTDRQKDIIIGNMLGDGHIDKRETQPMFIVSHAENQKDYLYWKYNELKDFCNTEPTRKPQSIAIINGKECVCQPSYRVNTRINFSLLEFRGKEYYEYLEQMNEFSFSIWMLDDGHRTYSNWGLCFAQYTDYDKSVAIGKFEELGLKGKIQKDIRYFLFDSDSSRKIDKIILGNIPNRLDIVQYKIIDKKTTNAIKRITLKNGICLSDYCKDNNINYKSVVYRYHKYKYSVEETIERYLNEKV